MKLLVTGAAGFIGSHFARLALRELPNANVVILDALTYAGNLSTIADIREQVGFVHARIQDRASIDAAIRDHDITHIVNFAAESHNDRSILEAGSFIQTDVLGVYTLLEAARDHGIEKLVHVSTDEVYGSILEGEFTEESPIRPNTQYSASKAGGDLQVRAHVKAFRTPAAVTRGGNTYGPFQFPEKLISFFAVRLIDGKKVPLYGEGEQVREWIHAEDHARGILTVLLKGEAGEVYNVGDANERMNREIVEILLEETGRDASLVKRISDPRKGAHDQRYSMSAKKLEALGWKPQKPFEESLRETVRWYRERQDWWRPLVERDEYKEFIARFYGPSLGEDL